MKLTAYKTRVFQVKEDLPSFIKSHVPVLVNGDILVVSSKLICLWKGCVEPYRSKKQKEQFIYQQSQAVLKTKLAYLTLKNNMVMTNAGIDESNANGYLVSLPEDVYGCATELRRELKKLYGLTKLGIILTDSMILPMRTGVIGAAIAYSGFKGVRDERGKKDIFGRALNTTFVNLADALAAAAAVLMGERNEQTPLCRIEQAPVQFINKTNPAEISYPPEQDLYAPLFKAVGLIKRRKK